MKMLLSEETVNANFRDFAKRFHAKLVKKQRIRGLDNRWRGGDSPRFLFPE